MVKVWVLRRISLVGEISAKFTRNSKNNAAKNSIFPQNTGGRFFKRRTENQMKIKEQETKTYWVSASRSWGLFSINLWWTQDCTNRLRIYNISLDSTRLYQPVEENWIPESRIKTSRAGGRAEKSRSNGSSHMAEMAGRWVLRPAATFGTATSPKNTSKPTVGFVPHETFFWT